MKKALVFLVVLFFPFSFLYAENIISRITIEGNNRISDATIISNIKARAQQPYNENVVNGDVKTLFGLGFFENIEVEKIKRPDGLEVIFTLHEKPVVKQIVVSRTRYIKKRNILETLETMDLKEGSFFDEFKIKKSLEKITDMYRKKGFSTTSAAYTTEIDQADNSLVLNVTIDEQKIARIRRIVFKGNTSFAEKRLKKLIKTRERALIKRGVFKQDVLEDDIERLKDFYIEQGFSEVKVEGSWDFIGSEVYITFKIDEGERYNLGKIDVTGNVEIGRDDLFPLLKLKEDDIFITSKVEVQALALQSYYFDKGYIFAQVRPISFLNPDTGKVDITFQINENEINYVEMIMIRGNERTKDKVIRRELRIAPGDKFEGEKIKKSRQRLENLGFFEDIRFDTEPSARPNWQNLVVEVNEAKTGYLSFGGGYSSIDEFVGFVELRQRNFDYQNWQTFTGAGQDLSIAASFGTLTEAYELSFTNPYVFDSPYSFGFDVYRRQHKREEDVGYGYDSDTRGGALRVGREFSDTVKAGITYRLETVEISDVVADATQELKDEVGENDLSSLELNFSWDTRDNVFNPTQGQHLSNTFQMTGGALGGDKDFFKLYSRYSIFFPLINRSVLELRARAGWADPFSGTPKVPIYERFFAGGSNTIRGYHERKIGPIDSVTEDPIGGESLFIGNVEYTYPLTDFLKTAVFFDTGNVWAKNSDFLSGNLKSSVGLGLRVKTPLGPISLDYGWPLDIEPGEEGKEGRFHFSISRGF